MNCPRCETRTLQEKERQGITIDSCDDCRGIWLDRGELEKLIVRAHRELEESRPAAGLDPRAGAQAAGGDALSERRGRGDWERRDWRDDDDDLDDDGRRSPRRKRGFLESLGELFD